VRRGTASNRLALFIALAVVLVGVAVLLVGRSHDARAPIAGPGASTETGPSAHDAPLAEIALPPRPAGDEATRRPAREYGPSDYAGRGRVRGELVVAPGISFPAAWTLVLEPHPYMVGSEHAISKRVEFESGERTFEVDDLPLGGYRVRAEVTGVNSTESAVLLVKGSSDPFVTLELRPAGLIDGRVFAADGAPADGLEVVLEPKVTQVRARATVGPDGAFVFHGVVDGEYRLWFGAPEAPLFPPADIAFSAPTLRIPDRTLPPTGAIAITTVDERGSFLGGVEVTGSGAPKGALRVTTGTDGRTVARWLMPGTYRLDARSPDGRRAKSTIAVAAGEPVVLTIRILDT
jgi:hypothetical protein